jgi:hypothetical protein
VAALKWMVTSTQDQEVEGDVLVQILSTNLSSVGQVVPRPDRYVWTIQTLHAASSARDYAAFCSTNDLSTMGTSTGVMRDCSKDSFLKQLRTCGAVLDAEHREFFSRGLRLAFAFDDRDQTNVLRTRITVTSPVVEAREFIADVQQDFGYSVADQATAAYKSLLRLCLVERGRRDNKGIDCKYVDE